ncbi:TetR/AcrR family transcriptional regulator [Longimicrobium sp.]|jgi:AcrR family transcriptional regulator|uniref:TetR/AcrR family transcriptional regulator n=1 Tax=Longimicrobium sp. TaxID=2029185 RepID=UPI002ED9C97D
MPGERASEDVRREQILGAAFEVAAREGLGGLTIRAVAGEAGLSHGLVLFHFGSKERLVHALLGWLIENTPPLRAPDPVGAVAGALDRLHLLLDREVARYAGEPRRTRLFYEYWALGGRDEAIRVRVGAELERYRAEFRDVALGLLQAEPGAFAPETAERIAAVAVSWIHGCAVQAVIDPVRFQPEESLASVREIIAPLAG